MIFSDEKFTSKYDIGVDKVEGEYSVKDLAQNIKDIVTNIQETLYDGEKVELKHVDNKGDRIYITKPIEKRIYNRTEKGIEDLLNRPQSSIKANLADWGVIEPNRDSSDYCDFLKLLYLFYMIQYVLFPEEKNVFHILSMKTLSTDFSPLENASNGKYLSFIMLNLMDDKEIFYRFLYEDSAIEKGIRNIANLLDDIVQESKLEVGKNFGACVVPRVIIQTRKDLDMIFNSYNSDSLKPQRVVEQAFDYTYRYNNLAHATEMLDNLNPQKNPFKFEDIEETIPDELAMKKIYIDRMDEVVSFVNADEIKRFCMKGKNKKWPKYYESFLTNIFTADGERMTDYGNARWIAVDNEGRKYILGRELTLIMRTFEDLKKTKYNMYVKLPQKNIEYSRAYQIALADRYPEITMKYFLVAYESEHYALRGAGTYVFLFKPLCLEKYILIQEIMLQVFQILDPTKREDFLQKIYDSIIRNQEP